MILINSRFKLPPFKPLKDLNLINSFLFDSSMENQENAQKIAKIIIKRATGRTVNNIFVETQKELKPIEQGLRGIRMDVLVTSTTQNNCIKSVFDIEPNCYYEPFLPKRTLYYNSMVITKLLQSKDDFKELPELFSIWILTYDPFGADRMIYTVKNKVEEDYNLVYNDGVTNLFLYTDGKIGGSKELRALLKHMTNTIKENATDPELEQIQNIVDSIKCDRKVGERYMSFEKMYEEAKQGYYELGKEDGWNAGRQDGWNAGREDGWNAGREDGWNAGRQSVFNDVIPIMISSFKEFGLSDDEIKDRIMLKLNLSADDVLNYLNKLS